MGAIVTRNEMLADGEALVVRTARPDDAAAVNELMRRVAAEGHTVSEPDELDLSDPSKRGQIGRYHGEPDWLFLVAETSNRVVGFTELRTATLRKAAHSARFSIFLEAGFRTRGVGTQLLSALLDWAVENPHIEKITLSTFANNAAGIGLYSKLGFREEGRCPRDLKLESGEYLDSVLMYRFV